VKLLKENGWFYSLHVDTFFFS